MPRCQIYALKLMAELSYPIEDIRIYAGTIKSFFVKENLAKIELDYGNIAEAIAAYEDLAEREDQRWGKNKYREIFGLECFSYKEIYLFILDKDKLFYYRGLKEYQKKTEKGYLIDTLLAGAILLPCTNPKYP